MSFELTRVQAELTDPVPLPADKDHAVAGNLLAADTLQEGQARATLLMSGQGLPHPLKVDSDWLWYVFFAFACQKYTLWLTSWHQCF